MNNPLVSIVMVNFNHEDFIGAAIESVIHQTYENWELIVVDDGSTDRSGEIICGYAEKDSRIRPVLREKNCHICVATNVGLSLVKGDYVARLDSDDLWKEDKLERQLAFMEDHPEGALCFTKLDIIDDKDRIVNEEQSVLYDIYNGRQEGRKGWFQHFFFFGNTLIQSSLLMKREVLDTVGGFNLAYIQGHDFDFFVRAIKKFDFLFLEEPLTKYRRFENQNSEWNENNNWRFLNEHMNVRYHFFDDMSDELFLEMFGDRFQNPGSRTHEELQIEQAFLLCKCIRGEDVNPVLGLKKLEGLFKEPGMTELLEEKYNFTLKDYYKEMLRPLFVTDAMMGELGYLRNLTPMLEGRVKWLEQENEGLKQETENLKQRSETLMQENENLKRELESLRQEAERLQKEKEEKGNKKFWRF